VRSAQGALAVGQAQDDAVVGDDRGDVDPGALAQAFGEHEGPGAVHARAEGAVHHDAPVPELVAEGLDHDRAVVGHAARREALGAHVVEQVLACPVVEARAVEELVERRGVSRAVGLVHGAYPGPCRLPELGGAPRGVALPEGQAARLTGGGRHDDAVPGDLLDAPGARAEGDGVSRARLVDHLLVELAHAPPAAVLSRDDHGEQSPVRDGPARGDREALRPGSGAQGVRASVPQDAGAQLAEGLARVAPREHVEHRGEHRVADGGEGFGPAHHGGELGDRPVLEGDHRDDLLREHVERVAQLGLGLELPAAHAARGHRARDEVAAVRREHHRARDGPHLVASATRALQPARDRGRGTHLDHEVEGPDVDAELEGARRDHRGQVPGLEPLLDRGALGPAHRAVVAQCDDALVDPGRRAGLPRHVRGPGLAARGQLLAAPGGPHLVHARREPLGPAARVREHEGRAVRGDEVDDPLVDVRPDRGHG
jgi:hypothetical protein